MKKSIISAAVMLCCAAFFFSCDEKENNHETAMPQVALTAIDQTETSLTISIIITDAEKAAYVCLSDGESVPEAGNIFETGYIVKEDTTVVIDGLEAGTEYIVAAAAMSGDVVSEVEQITMSTLQAEEPDDPEHPDSQKLYVARFAKSYVETIENGIVTFSGTSMTSSVPSPVAAYNKHTYFDWETICTFNDEGILDAEGNEWHLPSFSEMVLLCPDGYAVEGLRVVFGSSTIDPSVAFNENQSGDSNGPIDMPSILGTEEPTVSYLKKETEENGGGGDNVVYGIRFAGSDQAAAYRWESAGYGTENSHISIRIVALPNRGVDMTFDNTDIELESWWAEQESVDITIPGLRYATPAGVETVSSLTQLWTTTSAAWGGARTITYFPQSFLDVNYQQDLSQAYMAWLIKD